MNNSTSLQLSQGPSKMDLSELVTWCTIFTVVDMAIVFGNSLAIAVFYTNKRLLRTRANYFLINLAIADMLVGTIALPMFVYHLAAWWNLGSVVWTTPLYRISLVVDVFVGCASVFTLTVIALERLYSVCWPHSHRQAKLNVYFVQLGILWLLSGVVAALRLMYAYELLTLNFFFYFLLSTFAVSLFIICVAYIIIWYKMKFRFSKSNSNDAQRKSTMEHEKRLAIMLSTVTAVFVFTWLPFQVVNTVSFFCKPCRNFPPQLAYILKVFHFSNSFVNPIVYSFLVPEFRKTVKKLLKERSFN